MGKLPVKRFLDEIAYSDIFSRQMRFVAGPRQSGKTTSARLQLDAMRCGMFYYNWDRREIRERYRKEGDFFSRDLLNMPPAGRAWACFDEIHKAPKWKNILKDFFDTHQDKASFIVTGSARLDMFRRAGDSLAGRYFLFKMNPLLIAEMAGRKYKDILPEDNPQAYVEKMIAGKSGAQRIMDDMLRFSSFPEPLMSGNEIFSKKWHQEYPERIIKEDLRDISSIHNLEKVMDLIYLLPGKIGVPLSINALREDLELNFNTVKSYMNYLVLTYVLFEVPPYHRKKTRLVKSEKKAYFFDLALVDNPAARFENFVALELLTRVNLWNDSAGDTFKLCFVKMRGGNETDFLLTRNNAPYLLIEAKSSAGGIDRHHYAHSALLGNIPFVQLTREKDILKTHQNRFFEVSASRFLS